VRAKHAAAECTTELLHVRFYFACPQAAAMGLYAREEDLPPNGDLLAFLREQRMRMIAAGPGPSGRYETSREALSAIMDAALIERVRGMGGVDEGWRPRAGARAPAQPPVAPPAQQQRPEEGKKKHRR
jgi:hypothetical protein